jgi:transformation/transcription domain-associated protein
VEKSRETVPKICTELLLIFPNELTSARRELFVIMKHMIDSRNLELQPYFIPYIEQLLDDKALLGTSRSSYETLRPLAYNIVADLIHQVRKQLTPGQISKSVTFFTKVMYDPTLSLTYIQIMSAKLLVHLIESIFTSQSQKKPDEPSTSGDKIDKKIIIHLMSAFVTKLKSLANTINELKKIDLKREKSGDQNSTTEEANNNTEQHSDQITDISEKDSDESDKKEKSETSMNCVAFSPYKTNSSFVENVNHCRTMFRTLLVGLKNVIFVMRTVKTSPTQGKNRFSEEIKLFMILFKHGVDCFPVYSIGPAPTPTEEKQSLDNFSSLFTIIPVQTFLEIFKEQLPYLYQKSIENPIYLNIPSHFLASNQVASHFTDIMLKYLIDRMDRMSGTSNESNTMLKLFKIIIGSVVSFQNNEAVLKPHLASIVNNCLTYASRNKESINYFLTLRALFRSIVSGKFDLLVKEFLPLVPIILEKLTEFLKGSFKSNVRELFIELCLTIPAKLHVLCPYLPLLVRPVLYALQSTGKDDLVTYALRNLDIWVNSLRIESLEPILKPVMPELLNALFSHLKPAPYQYGNLAMRILAKLGGINRKYIAQPSLMEIHECGEDALTFKVQFNAQKHEQFTGIENTTTPIFDIDHNLSVDSLITMARKVIFSGGNNESRVQAFEYLKTCLLSMVDFPADIENFKLPADLSTFKFTAKTNVNIYACNNFFDPYEFEERESVLKTQKKVDAESEVFKSLLSTMLFLVNDTQLQTQAQAFVTTVCRHFALVTLLTNSGYTPDYVRELNPDLFLDAIVDVFCMENNDERNAGEFAMEHFIEVIDIACSYEDNIVDKLAVWEKLAARFSHCCYQREWYKKCGGCLGIVSLCQNLPLSWVKKHEIEFVKTLLFIIKDSPTHIAMFTIEEAKKALEAVIKICFTGNSTPQTTGLDISKSNQPDQKKFHDLVLVLVSELSSAHAPVRKTVQSLIKLVSELSNKSITSLLEPFRVSLNNSIREDRFTGLPVHLQTGFCEAVTFFLSLDPPLLNLTPQIKRIVDKALTIASGKKDEQNQNKDVDRKNQFALKMSCMKLLREALNSPDLKATEHQTLRNKIIEVFFNYLASVNKDVVAISKSGLATFIFQQRLPKDLLQTSLRPILSNLGNVQKLTLPVLQTLSHLLELCTSYFSVKLGEQLREHLKKWQDPAKITHLPVKGDAPQVAAKILALFSLLPPDAKKFLKELVPLVIQLENAWSEFCTEYSSPFRKPLARFLNQYPEETISFFFGPAPKDEESLADQPIDAIVIDQEPAFKMFVSILKAKSSNRLREAAQDADTIVNATLLRQTTNEAVAQESMIKGLYIIKILVKLMPKWLSRPQNQEIYNQMINIWNAHIAGSHNQLNITFDQNQVKKSKYLLKCFINYARHKENEVDTLFLMLQAFTDRATIDCIFLRDFYEKEVPQYSIKHKQLILMKYIQIFKNTAIPQPTKVEGLQHLVIPVIVAAIDKREEKVVDKTIMDEIDQIVKSYSIATLGESLKVELMQLCTLFVKYMTDNLLPYRKIVIKFIFDQFKKHEDSASKQCAYLLGAHFIKNYLTPEKLITNIYYELLKAYQSDGKSIIKQALDIILQVLPGILHTATAKSPHPMWIACTKRVIVDEIHSIPQLLHVYQVIVRHPNEFYPYRELFAPRIITSLNRIGTSSNSFDHKKLSIDLAELVLNWEEKASQQEQELSNPNKRKLEDPTTEDVSEPAAKKMKISEDGDSKTTASTSAPPPEMQVYHTPLDKAEILVNFVTRMSFLVYLKSDAPQKMKTLSTKCIEIVRRAVKVWPGAKIQFPTLEKFIPKSIEQAKQTDVNMLGNTLTILQLMLELGMQDVIQSYIGKFGPNLPPYIFSTNQNILEAMALFFKKLLEIFSPKSTPEVDQFYTAVWELITDSLNKQVENIDGVLIVLQIMSGHVSDREKLQYSKLVHKVFAKLLFSEHIPATANAFKQAQQQQLQQAAAASTAQASQQAQGAQGAQPTQPNQPNSQGAQGSQPTQPNQPTQPAQPAQPPQQSPAALRQLLIDITKSNNLHVKAIQICIDFLSDGVHEQVIRKAYLNSIFNLILKNTQINPEIVIQVVKKLQNWLVFANPNPSVKRYELTPPQKKHFLDSMITYLQNNSPMLRDAFYDVLLVLYQDQDLLRSDAAIASKVEAAFMAGLRVDTVNRKMKFLDVLNQRLGKSVIERLNFIFESHRWETLNDAFWVRYALDLLVDSLKIDLPLETSDHTCKLGSLMFAQSENQQTDVQDYMAVDEGEAANKSTTTVQVTNVLRDLLKEHSQFITTCKDSKLGQLISPLRNLARESVRMSYDLWVKLFPLAWASLTDFEREKLYQPLLTLLARDYHSKQYVKYPNVIQALLEGVSKCEPSISISPEMLKFLGKSFNAWSIAIPMMEKELQALITNGLFDERTERFCNSLAELYRVLSEEDMLCGIWNNHDISDITKFIFSLEQQGKWSETQEALKHAMYSLQKSSTSKRLTHSELSIWEEHWLTCAKKLQQWDELTKYAKQSSSAGLMLECYWKNGNWKQMKELFSKHPVAENQMMRIYHISVAIMENKEKEALEHFQQASQLALQRWCALPSFLCSTHIGMLHNFQQLLELHESHQLLGDSARPLTSSELKAFLSTWRDRVPNKWDDISMWTDILTWRCHFLKFMSKKFEGNKVSEHHRALCLNEAIWTQNKLAKICRKQDFIEPALKLLGEAHKLLNTLKIESNESFVRIYEILKCYMREGRYNDALDLIDSDMSAKLKNNHKMDVLRLRGECLSKLGRKEDAYHTFSQSISYFPQDPRYLSAASSTLSLGKTFFAWGKMLDDVFTNNLSVIAQERTPATVNNMQQIDIAENAIICYMQALRYAGGATNHHHHQSVGWNCRQHISRILWLLSYDNKEMQLSKVMEKCINDIPAWMWIPYVQNLFSMLLRGDNEAKVAKTILVSLSKKYPQAIYYNLRSLYFELREVVKAGSPPKQEEASDSSSTATTPNGPVDVSKVMKHSEELMALILRHYQSMVHEIEAILKEICARLKPEIEEELQRALENLLSECYKHNIFASATEDSFRLDDDGDSLMGTNQQNAASIPIAITKQIEEIFQIYFVTAEQPTSSFKLSQYLKDSKDEIKVDLLPTEENGPQNLADLTLNIKKWLKALQKRVNLLPKHLPLESLSPYLADSHTIDIEIPGQYTEFDREPSVEQHEKIMCFLPDVDVVRRNKVSCRRISMRSQSGKVYHYLVQSIGPTESTCFGRSEERTWSFIRHFNRLLEKDKGSHRKNLQLHMPTIVPLSHKIRLVHERPSYTSLEDVYHDHAAKMGINSDRPILTYWQVLNSVCDKHTHVNIPKQDAFTKISTEMVPDDILFKYLNSACVSWNEFFQLRKMMSMQVGLYSMIEYLLNIEERALHKVQIGKNSGEMFQFDFRPTFNGTEGKLSRSESVPFRMTRNMQNFISPFGLQGILLNSMSVASHGLVQQASDLESLLQLFIRDELIAWQNINSGVIDAKFAQDETLLKQTVQLNIEDVMTRLKEMAPVPPAFVTTNPDNPTPADLGTQTDNMIPSNEKIVELIKQATSEDQLSLLPPTLHPWF